MHSQTQMITWKIVAFKGFPINRATIKSKKTDQAVISDKDGQFTIKCNKKDALNTAAAGFYGQTVKIKMTRYLLI